MSVGLYRAAVAMVGNERRLDAIASNLANLETIGFKKSSTSAREFVVQGPSGPIYGQDTHTITDFSQGNLRRTKNPLDIALFGDGFFALESPQGEVYTRSGTLHTTPEGVLVTEEGWEVGWERRSGVIDPAGMPIEINGEGYVRQGNLELGQLKIVDFSDKSSLELLNGGYWNAGPGAVQATATAEVQQYALEESNAAGVEEIVAMIGVQRSFESAANLVQSIQQSYSRLTRSSF